MQQPENNYRNAGFTLIEVGIIVPILIVMLLIIFDALFAMIRTSSVEGGKIDITYDRQTAMSNIESDTVLASLYIPTTDASTNDPYAPSGGWSYEGSGANSRVLIAQMYATDINPYSSNRRPAFINDNDPVGAACAPANLFANEVQQYNVIYFVQNGNLFRRRVINTSNTLCSPGQYQKLSCPAIASRDASCSADDEVIAQNVSQFSIDYYGSKTSTTPLAVYSGGTAEDRAELLSTAADAEITLTLTKTVSGNTVSSSSKLRMSKLNAKIED